MNKYIVRHNEREVGVFNPPMWAMLLKGNIIKKGDEAFIVSDLGGLNKDNDRILNVVKTDIIEGDWE
jgi:hypothetical protein